MPFLPEQGDAAPIQVYLRAALAAALFGTVILAVLCDIREGRIPNRLPLAATVLGLVLHTLIGNVWAGDFSSPSLLTGLSGLAAGGLLLFPFYLVNGVGAGDVKLLAAVGALSSAFFALTALFYASLVGGVMAIAVLIWKGELVAGLTRTLRLLLRRKAAETAGPGAAARLTIPYGVAIGIGTLWAYFVIL
jgi:prepilin peptidase CpaA